MESKRRHITFAIVGSSWMDLDFKVGLDSLVIWDWIYVFSLDFNWTSPFGFGF